MKKYFITIKKEDEGCRLDKVIPANLTDISRGEVRRAIQSGGVSIDGKRVRTHSRPVREGQTIVIHQILTPAERRLDAPVLEVLFDDPWFIVVSKPSGMPSDTTQTGDSGTITDILSRKHAGKTFRSVHRLDKGTSGVMVVSKTPAATRGLSLQFQNREVRKKYAVLVHGIPKNRTSRIVSSIDRSAEDPRKFRSVFSGGKEAITEYSVLSSGKLFSLLEVEIFTGRTHQIRVHLSEQGHPVAGDWLYGIQRDGAPRLMLHAQSLTFRCPRTDKMMTFESPIPVIFNKMAGSDHPE